MDLNNPKNKVLLEAIQGMYGDKIFISTANERHQRAVKRVDIYFPSITKNYSPVHVSALSLETAYPDDKFGNTDLEKIDIITINSCLLSLLNRISQCNCSDCQQQAVITTSCMKKLMAIYHSLPYKE